MSRFARALLPVLFSLSAALLGACGSGGNDAPPPPPACVPIADNAGGSIPCEDAFWSSSPGGGGGADGDAGGADGTAGDGKAIVGATVTLIDANGATRSAVTDSQGYYRFNITRLTPPFVLKLVTADGEERHHSFSTQAVKKRGFITINITGLTDKLSSDLAVAAGKTGAKDLTPAIVAAQAGAIPGARNSLAQAIRAQIIAAGLNPDTFDPIGVFFRPNLQGHDLVLETVAVYIDNAGATQVLPKPQNACTAPRRWLVGNNLCTTSNSPGFVAHGSTTAFSDNTAPLVGSVELSCSNGTLLATTTAPTCAPPANQPCNAPSAAWNVGSSSCTADSAPGSVVSGQSLTLTDSHSPVTGSITYACSNGTLTQTGTSTCTDATVGACAAPAAGWSVGSNSCFSDTTPTGLLNGQSLTLKDLTGAATGAVTYTCTNGVLGKTGTAECALVPQSCSAPNAVWNVGNAECTSDSTPGPLTTGQSVTLNDTKDPGLGSITYSCTNGSLSRTGAATCTSPSGGTGCDAPSSAWTVQGLTCQSGTTPTAMSSDEQQTLSDSSAPTTGSIVYRCNNASLSIVGAPACTGTPGSCAPPSANWSSGESNCSADSTPPALSNSQSITLNDTASPTTGSVTWSCSNGTLAMIGSPTCNTSQSASCTAPARSWSVQGSTCSSDTAPTPLPSGGSVTLNDATSPGTGQITYACNNGTLAIVGSASCTGGGSANFCSTSSLAGGWSVSGSTCNADQLPTSVSEGSTLVLDDTQGATNGSITVECRSGSLNTVGTPTCSGRSSSSSCQVNISSWGSGYVCQPDQNPGTVTIQPSGTFTWTDTIGATGSPTGSHTMTCNNGSASVVSSTCGFGGLSARPGTSSAAPAPAAAPRRSTVQGSNSAAPAPAQARRVQ